MRNSIIILLLLLLTAACGDRPGGVPSRGKMERILYDYHKAQAIMNVGVEDRSLNAEECMLYVLNKHGMNSEMFDSAMIWYCEHPDQLQKIYQHLEERLKAEDEEMQAKVGTSNMSSIYSEGGDTTNLWTGAPLIVLRPENLQCVEQFTLKADSSYHKNDRFIFNADTKFVKEDQSLRSILYMCLSIKTADGKTYSQVNETRVSTIQRIDLSQSTDEEIKEVSGYFYYKADKTAKSICVINGISLVRMHIEEKVDTTANDSTAADSIDIDNQPRMQVSPDIPSVELSEDVPERTTKPAAPAQRRNEVEDIRLRRAPSNPSAPMPTQRRQSVQKGRGQNTQPQPMRRQQPRQQLQVAPANRR